MTNDELQTAIDAPLVSSRRAKEALAEMPVTTVRYWLPKYQDLIEALLQHAAGVE